jgi:hypothetical protein
MQMPNRGGQGRRQFLVVYDTVPGGTGYLARLADPDRVKSILEAARESSRSARAAAKVDAPATAACSESSTATSTTSSPRPRPRPARRSPRRLEAAADRIDRRSTSARSRSPNSNGASRSEVAVYLDGYQFHASAEVNRLADDAVKRAAVRESGRVVWNLTWDDIELFHKAMTAEIRHDPPARPLLAGRARSVAQQAHLQRGGWFDAEVMHRNPMAMLLEFLANPNPRIWEELALSACAGAAAGGSGVAPVDAETLGAVLDAAFHGRSIVVGGEGAPVSLVAEHVTDGGLRVVLLLDAIEANAERWTAIVVMPDEPASLRESEHKARWHDWHQWANLLQFLTGDGRDVVIGTTTLAPMLVSSVDALWLASRFDLAVPVPSTPPAVSAPAVPAGFISAEMEEELELVEGDDVRVLVRTVLERGAPPFVAGGELPTGEMVEALWVDARVGVMPTGAAAPSHDGWDIRAADQWSADELTERIGVTG